jgi:uncharacterized protein YdaU (DUF1376 family)
MPDELPYMRLWVKDLLADVAEMGLTDEELGVYFRFLLVSWKKGSIPGDHAGRARLVTASPRKLAVLWPAIEGKWVPGGSGLVNPRQERERADAKAKSKKAKEAAEKRWKR